MKLIASASDCTIKTFITAKYDGNLSALLLEGEAEEFELLQALEAIETEYNDLSGNIPSELKKMNRANELTARKAIVDICFFTVDEALRLADLPMLEALPRLKSQGVNIKWRNDINDFKEQVKNAKIREISKEIELEELRKELETVQSKSTKSPQFTKKNFYQLIHAVQTLGFKIDESATNMYSFGVMCFDYYEMTKLQKGS